MAIVLSGTWETSEERKRNEESEESIVAEKRVMTVGIPRAEGESRSDALAGVRRVPALRAPQTGRRVPIRFGRSA